MTNNYDFDAPQPHPSAVKKEKGGLEWWEWRRPEDNVLQIQLTGRGVFEAAEIEKRAGDFLDDSDYVILASEEDVDIYKPVEAGDANLELFGFGVEKENSEDRLLMSLRKKVFSEDMTKPAWKILRHAAGASKNRGFAAGKATAEGLKKDPSRFVAPEDLSKEDLRTIDQQRLFASKNPMRTPTLGTAGYLTKDGYMSSTNESNMVYSGIVGNFNWTPRNPYCRQTAFTRDRFGEFLASMPFIEEISRYFKHCVPSRYEAQREFIKEGRLREKGWLLGNTIFSTITVNKNYRTGVHVDSGDFEPGFGNLTVLEGGADRYVGGRTIFPRFRCAVDLRTGDFLGMDVHEYHGNTEMHSAVEGKDDWERISVVCYVRVEMSDCGTIKEENHKQAKWFKERFKTPDQRHADLIARTKQEQEDLLDSEALLGVVGDHPTDPPDPKPSKDSYMEGLADKEAEQYREAAEFGAKTILEAEDERILETLESLEARAVESIQQKENEAFVRDLERHEDALIREGVERHEEAYQKMKNGLIPALVDMVGSEEEAQAVLNRAAANIKHYRENPPTPEQVEADNKAWAEHEAGLDDSGRPWGEPPIVRDETKTALWIVGEPGVGKTTLVRGLLAGRELSFEEPPKWTVSGDWVLAGHYKGATFDGGDQLSTNVLPIIDLWIEKYLPKANLSIFDGDRFSFKGAYETIGRRVRTRVLHLVAPEEVTAARRTQRGSNQNAQWVKGRKTKSETFANNFEEADRLVLDATESPEALKAKVQAWLRGETVVSFKPESDEPNVLDMFS